MLFFTAPKFVSADINTGLVGYWTMDGRDVNWSTNTLSDRSGNGNTGTLKNMSTTTSPVLGKVGQALKFDGTNDYINVGAGNLSGATSFSYSAWIYTSSSNFDNNIQVVMDDGSGGDPTTGNGFYVALDDRGGSTPTNGFNIMIDTSTGSCVGAFVSNVISSARWYHVVLTYNGNTSTKALYIDGSAVSTTNPAECTGSGNFVPGSTINMAIGDLSDGAGLPVNGYIDETRLYTRALSSNDVVQLYKQGQTKISQQSTRPSSDALSMGLVGYWTMNGIDTNWTTNTISDKSGTGNDVAVTNMSTTTSPVLGKVGQALKFDGSDDYLAKASFSALSMSITLSSWAVADIPADGSSDAYFSIVSKGGVFTDGSNFAMGVRRREASTDWRIYCYWRDDASNLGGGEIVIPVSGSSPISGWHHYSCVINSDGSISAYFDGALAGTAAASVPFGTVSHALRIGGPINVISTDKMWKGYIDETRIYNRALSAQEVSQLYRRGQTKSSISPITKPSNSGLSSGLVAYWSLDGKHINWAANTATDLTGNGHTATLVGLSTTTSPVIGKIGQALKFTASTNRLASPSSSATAFGTGDFSLSVWVKTSGYANQGSSINTVVARNFVGAASAYGISYGSNNLPTCRVDTGVATSGGTSLADGNWHHLVLVRRGDVVECWEDNTKLTDGSTTANLSGSSPMYIGNDNNSFFRGNSGPVDDIRLYNRSLSTQEIGQLFKMGQSKRK